MLTAARAWVGTPRVRCHGVISCYDHPRCHRLPGEESVGRKSHRRKLVMTGVVMEGTAVPPMPPPPPPPICGSGVERDAGLWIRYSRKRKKLARPSAGVGEEEGPGTGDKGAGLGKQEEVGAAMGSPTGQFCSGCGTSRTPLWRKGPAGPKSLCNACGIRYRKMLKGGLPFSNAVAMATATAAGDLPMGDPLARPNTSVSVKLTATAATAGETRKEEEDTLRRRQRRRREVLWLLLEESRKVELPCGKEAVEAAVLLMAMSSGLFLRSQ